MSGSDRAPTLSIRGLTHHYGAFRVLDEVDLSVVRGEVHCLLGPSGSGKSTLLRLVAGLEEIQRGEVAIDGETVASRTLQVPPERRPVGFVFQDYALFPHLDVERNVTFGMVEGGSKERAREALRLLRRVGMEEFVFAMPHTLSGGQQQRVALARALARRPAVMLLDEPFSGLDARLREEVRRSTVAVLRESGVATLIVTHDPREALALGDRISVLRRGRVMQTGTAHDVYLRSVDREVAEVFGPLNRFVGLVREGHVTVPWGSLPVTGLEEGAQVEVCVRTESLLVERASEGRAEEESWARGVVVAVQRLGAAMDLIVQLEGGANVRASDYARRGWTVGESVLVSASEDESMVRSLE